MRSWKGAFLEVLKRLRNFPFLDNFYHVYFQRFFNWSVRFHRLCSCEDDFNRSLWRQEDLVERLLCINQLFGRWVWIRRDALFCDKSSAPGHSAPCTSHWKAMIAVGCPYPLHIMCFSVFSLPPYGSTRILTILNTAIDCYTYFIHCHEGPGILFRYKNLKVVMTVLSASFLACYLLSSTLFEIQTSSLFPRVIICIGQIHPSDTSSSTLPLPPNTRSLLFFI